jgi:hypothetical protein
VIASIRALLKKVVPGRTRLNISSTIEEVIPLALGDVRLGSGNVRVYMPFASMLLLSVVLSLVAALLRRR